MVSRKFLILGALVFAFSFLAAVDAQAAHDTLTTYYTGSCPNGLEYNGYHFRECDNTVTQDGTLDGTWKCEDWYDCFEATFTYWWFEKCNGQWVFRYMVDNTNEWPYEEDCHCT